MRTQSSWIAIGLLSMVGYVGRPAYAVCPGPGHAAACPGRSASGGCVGSANGACAAADAPCPPTCPMHRAGPGAPSSYDPSTVESISGTIQRVETGPRAGVHLTLQTASELTTVALGPAWFVEGKGIRLAAGESLDVTGSRIGSGDQAMLIAREIRQGKTTLVLRSDSGLPRWRGSGRGAGRRGRARP